MLSLPQGMNEHYGRNVDKMSKLLKAGETPMSVSGIMRARLEQGNDFPDLWNNWHDTSDLVVYPKGNDKEVYVFLTTDNQGQITQNGKRALELIRSDNLASNCGAVVEQLRDLGRKGLIKIPRSKITSGNYFTGNQILDEQVWRIFARHPDEVSGAFAEDSNLLKEYEEQVRAKTGQNTNMALYLGDSLKNQTTLKAWYVDWLVSRSYASGRLGLGVGNGRLLGIAPEAPNAPGKGELEKMLEVVGAHSPEDVQRALNPEIISVTQLLNNAGHTSAYAPDQIKKLQNIMEQGEYRITKK